MSVCPSVSTKQLGFLWADFHEIWYLGIFRKFCRGNSIRIKIWQEWRLLHMKTNTHFWSYLAQFFLAWEMLQREVFFLPRQAEVTQGIPGWLRPRIFLTFRHYKGGRSSAKRTGRLYPSRNPWYSLSEAESTSVHMVLSGVPRKKIPSDTTGNRSRDLPTSSAVP